MAKVLHPMRWVVWSLGATFYLFEYFLRVSPSVMVSDLMTTFGVNALAVGSLSAFYFYIYAPMQIPVGPMIDRYGARRLLAISALIAGVGTFLFGIAPIFSIAALGRFLMGFGSAFGFVAVIYICTHWFHEKQWGLMIGLGNTCGMLGAILGQGPLRASIDNFGWRPTIFTFALFAFLLSGLIFWLVRNDPPSMKKERERKKRESWKLFQSLKIVTMNSQTWVNSIVALFLYVPTATFAGLWGVPFIHSIYKISITEAGFAISMVFVGWAVGGPLIGLYSDKIQRKKLPLLFSIFVGLILMAIIVYVRLPLFLLSILLFLIGFVSSAQLLNFSYAVDVNPIKVKGTAAAFTNFIVVIGTATLQPFVGYLLDLQWTGGMEGGARTYSPEAYTWAMSIFPISLAIALSFVFFMKRTKRI